MSDSGTEPKSRPRFVAGAVCPNCGAVDRMVIDANAERRRCVACEFVEARPEAPTKHTRIDVFQINLAYLGERASTRSVGSAHHDQSKVHQNAILPR